MPYLKAEVETFVELYQNDMVLRRSFSSPAARGGGGRRGRITELSPRSVRRLLFLLNNTDTRFESFLTMTYPTEWPTDGLLVRGDRNAYLTWLRSAFDFEYVWWLEFQSRGAPHFHMVTTIPWSAGNMMFVEPGWERVVKKRHPHLLDRYNAMSDYGCDFEKIRSRNGAARYVAKYAKKLYQKRVPPDYENVGRWWAASRGVEAVPHCGARGDGDGRREVLVVLSRLGWSYAERMLAILDRPDDMQPPTTLYNVMQFLESRGVPWDTFMGMVRDESEG